MPNTDILVSEKKQIKHEQKYRIDIEARCLIIHKIFGIQK